MNTKDANLRESIPTDILSQAGLWITRLHADDRNGELEAVCREWRRANPINERAFQLATAVWEDSYDLRRVVPFAHTVPTPGRRRAAFNFTSMVAAAALVALALVFLVRDRTTEIATGIGEQRSLTLEDGTRLYLNTATRVAVSYGKATRQVELQQGEALFEVAKRAGWPFVVLAGKHQVRALGTSFAVRFDPQQTAVTLVDGRVAVTPVADSIEADQSVVLAPGQRLTFSGHKPMRIDTPSLDQTTAWRRGQIILDATSLSDAVEEMNRYSNVKLVLEQSEIAGLSVSGLFQAGDSAKFAAAVAETYGLQVSNQRGEIVLRGLPRLADHSPR